jgi:hypothetical protein
MIWISLQLLAYFVIMVRSFSHEASGSRVDTKQEIVQTFQKYRTALLDADGDTAWALLDSHTTKFYAQALEDALSLSGADLERLDFVHKFTVLRLRLEFRRAELQQFTAQGIFVLAVTNGWISRSEVQSMETLDKVKVDDRYATAYLSRAPTTPAFYFIQEGSEWKIALWKTFELANATMQHVRRESRMSERAFIIDMLSGVSKYTVDEKIFDAPLD